MTDQKGTYRHRVVPALTVTRIFGRGLLPMMYRYTVIIITALVKRPPARQNDGFSTRMAIYYGSVSILSEKRALTNP